MKIAFAAWFVFVSLPAVADEQEVAQDEPADPAADVDVPGKETEPAADEEVSPEAAAKAPGALSEARHESSAQQADTGPEGLEAVQVPSQEPVGRVETDRELAPKESTESDRGVASEDEFKDVDLSKYLPQEGLVRPSIAVGVFADFGFYFYDGFDTSELRVGQVVFHTSAELSEQFSAFAELSLDSVPTPGAHVHRLLFRWETSDAFRLAVGRSHLPLTWWNSTFHHGGWLQTTATRPGFLDFSSSVLPTHAEGLAVGGRLPAFPQLGIRYEFGVSGGGADHGHADSASDDGTIGLGVMSGMTRVPQAADMEHDHGSEESGSAVEATVNGTLGVEPRAIPFLRLGISGLLGPQDGQDQAGQTTIGSAHVAYTSERPEVILEGVHIANEFESDDAQSSLYQTWAAYGQVAYRLRGFHERLKPYARYEQLIKSDEDPSLAEFEGYSSAMVGMRVDLAPRLSMKVEANRLVTAEQDAAWGGAFQWSGSW